MGEGIVVVTGASGYIGGHIVANLLSKGMHVRATVRDKNDPERVDHLKSMEIADGGSIEIVEMDLFDEGSVDSAISGCTDLIHTVATVIVRSRDPRERLSTRVSLGRRTSFLPLRSPGQLRDSYIPLRLLDHTANGLGGWRYSNDGKLGQ